MTDRLSAALSLAAPATSVAGVSTARAAAFAKLGIRTVRDVVCHYPFRYLDMSRVERIATAPIGQAATIAGTIHEVVLKRPRPRFDLVEVTVVDGSGTLICTFFRQPWLVKSLAAGQRVSVAGQVEFNYGYKRMTMPLLEKLEDDEVQVSGQIIPVHHSTQKVAAGQMRRIIRSALDAVAGAYDPLPLELRAKYRLMSRDRALECIHFPEKMDEAAQARRRLVYEEVLGLELSLMREQEASQRGLQACSHRVEGPLFDAVRAALSFAPTDDQERAIAEILVRMEEPVPMNHMLLGDVGTGKTAVALFALTAAAQSGTQALMMGPTEVLAQQYGASLGPVLDAAGISWGLLTGSTPAQQRKRLLEEAARGSLTVLFGTHALLEDEVRMASCSLVVVDEEQRFGVDQRKRLKLKGANPDVLSMTATPIPRSLALAIYGSKSLSYLHQVPFDRPARTTKVYRFRERGHAYDAAVAACERGEQVYVVCPLVGKKPPKTDTATQRDQAEDEQAYIESDADMCDDDPKAAQAEAAFLQAKTFARFRVGLLHGRLKSDEKAQVMDEFRAGAIDVLVSTTVIEVGVDVPNATVMIIEDADRFGLSQLHQLRGRVGRGTLPGEVYLVSSSTDEQAISRLSMMESTDDGFKLAEFDLSLRREGDILGNRQHGTSQLKLLNVMRDKNVIEAAHADAVAIMAGELVCDAAARKALFSDVDAVFDHNSDE